MKPETVEEKIRNKITPMFNLVKIVELGHVQSPQVEMNLKQLCSISELNFEYLIKLGNIVDKYLPEGFDINKIMEDYEK